MSNLNDNNNNLEGRDQSNDGASQNAGSSQSSSNDKIGFCHQCDRQVNIDPISFTCRECNGGFIELFDINSASRSSQQQQQQSPYQQQQQQSPQRVRVDTIRLNQGNMENFLPLFLPQLINPNANQAQLMHNIRATLRQHQQQQQAAASSSQSQPSAGQTTDSQQSNLNPEYQQQQGQTPSPFSSTSLISQTMPQSFQYGTPTTRLQFIVPGEQFDLYGIINNVLSNVLDPRRMGAASGAPQGAHFQFQPPPIRMFQLHGDLRDYAWGPTGLDAIITQLLNQLENTGPPPATEQQLQNIPTVKISQEEVEKNVQCSICMEDFKLNDEAKRMPCRHLFHDSCINEWLKLHGTCPVCRKNLNGEDTSQREYISRPPNQQQNPSNDSNTNEPTTQFTSASASASSSEPASNSNNNNSNNPNSSSSTSNNNNNNNNDSSNQSNNRNSNVYYDMDFD